MGGAERAKASMCPADSPDSRKLYPLAQPPARTGILHLLYHNCCRTANPQLPNRHTSVPGSTFASLGTGVSQSRLRDGQNGLVSAEMAQED